MKCAWQCEVQRVFLVFACVCSQSGSASQRAAGWSWVDGTDASNVNCGSGAGGDGCGAWNVSEPKYVDALMAAAPVTIDDIVML